MWQIQAMLAKGHIDDQLHDAQLRRRAASAPRQAPHRLGLRLPSRIRHPARIPWHRPT